MKKWHLFIFLFACPILCLLLVLATALLSLASVLPWMTDTVLNIGTAVCVLLQLLVFLPIILNTFVVHIVYFFFLGTLWNMKKVKSWEVVLFSLAFPDMTAVTNVIYGIVAKLFQIQWYTSYLRFCNAFEIICGFAIVSAFGVVKLFGKKRLFAIAMNVWSVLVLGITAGIMYYFKSVEPFAKVLKSGDFEVLYYLVFEMAILAICSVVFCYLTTKRHFWIKMVVWYFEIAVAMFFVITFWTGLDLSAAFKHMGYLSALIWTGPVWAFGLIGMALPKIQAENVLN